MRVLSIENEDALGSLDLMTQRSCETYARPYCFKITTPKINELSSIFEAPEAASVFEL